MKRTKVQHSSPPAYPDRGVLGTAFGPRLVLLGLLCLAPVPACTTVHDIDGLMANPSEDWGAVLPGEGSRTLYFSDGATLAYHLDVVVTDGGLAAWLGDNEETLLDRADQLLEAWGSEVFAEGAERWELEQEILQLLADAYNGVEDSSVASFVDCHVVVDGFEPAEGQEDDTG